MGKVAVITGASSGIGRSTAERFAKAGYSLAIVARRESLLNSLVETMKKAYPDQKFIPYVADVSSWSGVEELGKKIEADWPAVNVLINNAGAFDYGPLEKISKAKVDELIHVNVRGVIATTRFLLPSLKKGVGDGGAKIINVSSIAGLWGFPNMAAYSATKFAVAGFSSALSREFSKIGITVATIFPGPVNTKLPKGARPEKKMVKIPEDIAEQILKLADSSGRFRLVHPLFRTMSWLDQFSPKSVDKVLKKFL